MSRKRENAGLNQIQSKHLFLTQRSIAISNHVPIQFNAHKLSHFPKKARKATVSKIVGLHDFIKLLIIQKNSLNIPHLPIAVTGYMSAKGLTLFDFMASRVGLSSSIRIIP